MSSSATARTHSAAHDGQRPATTTGSQPRTGTRGGHQEGRRRRGSGRPDRRGTPGRSTNAVDRATSRAGAAQRPPQRAEERRHDGDEPPGSRRRHGLVAGRCRVFVAGGSGEARPEQHDHASGTSQSGRPECGTAAHAVEARPAAGPDVAPAAASRAYAGLRSDGAARRADSRPPSERASVWTRMNELVVQTHELTKRYGDRLAVDAVSLTVRRGEVYGFLGPNGAGKTTTLRMMLGLVRPTSGSARSWAGPPAAPEVTDAGRRAGRGAGLLPLPVRAREPAGAGPLPRPARVGVDDGAGAGRPGRPRRRQVQVLLAGHEAAARASPRR